MDTEEVPETEIEEPDETAEIIDRLTTIQQTLADVSNRLASIESEINERRNPTIEPEPEPVVIIEPEPANNPTETRETTEEPDRRIKPNRKHWYFRKF